jgi:hypothetical protein
VLAACASGCASSTRDAKAARSASPACFRASRWVYPRAKTKAARRRHPRYHGHGSSIGVTATFGLMLRPVR